MDARQRRQLRVEPPPHRRGWCVYASDGAARKQGMRDQRQASSGAVRYDSDARTVVASCGRVLGDESNNVAEFTGVCDAISHALANPMPRLAFRVDSKLVAEQLNCRWRCRAPDLVPLYERALGLLRQLRLRPGVADILVEHVYREFNADADGVCNAVLDMARSSPDAYGFVINNNWT